MGYKFSFWVDAKNRSKKRLPVLDRMYFYVDAVEEEPNCSRCNTPYAYDELYEAYYCAACNCWEEEACDDPDCTYCRTRPARPNDRFPL